MAMTADPGDHHVIPQPTGRVVLAIDPGPEQSAYLNLVAGQPTTFGIAPNDELLDKLRALRPPWHWPDPRPDVIVVEWIESYGMPVGREIFGTVHWSGRFTEAASVANVPVHQLPRRSVKVAICHDTRAKDTNIRAALIDRWGGPAATRKGGPLAGITKDVWSALAIAVTYAEGGR